MSPSAFRRFRQHRTVTLVKVPLKTNVAFPINILWLRTSGHPSSPFQGARNIGIFHTQPWQTFDKLQKPLLDVPQKDVPPRLLQIRLRSQNTTRPILSRYPQYSAATRTTLSPAPSSPADRPRVTPRTYRLPISHHIRPYSQTASRCEPRLRRPCLPCGTWDLRIPLWETALQPQLISHGCCQLWKPGISPEAWTLVL